MQSAVGSLLAVAEAYPDLKANTNFQHLQTELATLEEDLSFARRYYNGTVRNYNTSAADVSRWSCSPRPRVPSGRVLPGRPRRKGGAECAHVDPSPPRC